VEAEVVGGGDAEGRRGRWPGFWRPRGRDRSTVGERRENAQPRQKERLDVVKRSPDDRVLRRASGSCRRGTCGPDRPRRPAATPCPRATSLPRAPSRAGLPTPAAAPARGASRSFPEVSNRIVSAVKRDQSLRLGYADERAISIGLPFLHALLRSSALLYKAGSTARGPCTRKPASTLHSAWAGRLAPLLDKWECDNSMVVSRRGRDCVRRRPTRDEFQVTTEQRGTP
jgi:hypothetical protein